MFNLMSNVLLTDPPNDQNDAGIQKEQLYQFQTEVIHAWRKVRGWNVHSPNLFQGE